MRLSKAYEICQREKEQIKVYVNSIAKYYYDRTSDKNAYPKCAKLCQEFYTYVKENLSSIPYIAQILDTLSKEIENMTYENSGIVIDSIYEVNQRVDCVISMYELENYNEKNIGLDVKIPKIDNITELKKFIDGLEFVLTKCPFFQSNEESLKLLSVENGSIWLIFGVVGAVGASVTVGSVLLNNIAAFIDKCFVIKSHKLTCEMQKQQIQNEEMEQKEKEELFKSIDKLYKIAVKNVIKDMEASTGHQMQDGDEQGRAEQSFDKMIKMLDQGLQIHSSINSPEEVKALFKPLEMHYLSIERGLERIEEKEDTDSEQNE